MHGSCGGHRPTPHAHELRRMRMRRPLLPSPVGGTPRGTTRPACVKLASGMAAAATAPCRPGDGRIRVLRTKPNGRCEYGSPVLPLCLKDPPKLRFLKLRPCRDFSTRTCHFFGAWHDGVQNALWAPLHVVDALALVRPSPDTHRERPCTPGDRTACCHAAFSLHLPVARRRPSAQQE